MGTGAEGILFLNCHQASDAGGECWDVDSGMYDVKMAESWLSAWIWVVAMQLKGDAEAEFRSSFDSSNAEMAMRSLEEVYGTCILGNICSGPALVPGSIHQRR
jgi:hypothetical protein